MRKHRWNRNNLLLMDLVPTASSLLKDHHAFDTLHQKQLKLPPHPLQNRSCSPISSVVEDAISEKNTPEQGNVTISLEAEGQKSPPEPDPEPADHEKSEDLDSISEFLQDGKFLRQQPSLKTLDNKLLVPVLQPQSKKAVQLPHVRMKRNQYWRKVVRKHFVPTKNENKRIELDILKMRQQKAPKKKFNFVHLNML